MQEKRKEKKKKKNLSHSHLTEIGGWTMHYAAQAFMLARKGRGTVRTFSFVFWFSARRSSYSPIAKRKKKATLQLKSSLWENLWTQLTPSNASLHSAEWRDHQRAFAFKALSPPHWISESSGKPTGQKWHLKSSLCDLSTCLVRALRPLLCLPTLSTWVLKSEVYLEIKVGLHTQHSIICLLYSELKVYGLDIGLRISVSRQDRQPSLHWGGNADSQTCGEMLMK